MPFFELSAPFSPTGDQPQAIKKITNNIKAGIKHQVLLGVTGSGKTFTLANVIAKIQRPVLIISHNKTLAAQLYQEFKEFFPKNSVNYFVSYYDYYQPEAYLPQTDTYIQKDAKVNEEIDRLRHAATQNLLERPDTIIVASVSCIYNIGLPNTYLDLSAEIKRGQTINRQNLLRQLINLQYSREDFNFSPGSFRVRGENIEIWSATGDKIIKIELEQNLITSLKLKLIQKSQDLFTKKEININSCRLYPAKFWVASPSDIKNAIASIKEELNLQLKKLQKQNKILEAERLKRRTNYDLEMIAETGYCHGIENYSRHLENRPPGAPPYSLIDYFNFTSQIPGHSKKWLTFIDESHITVPQIGAMYEGDKARKETLINFGFRLPSALDNRPLKFSEFEEKIDQVVYVSATPGPYELRQAKKTKNKKTFIIEQLIRPTGLLDPEVEVRPTKNQIPDLIEEIKRRVTKKQRVLVTTLTKRLAEDLADFLNEEKIKTLYLHSEIKTLERPQLLKKLRQGDCDVLVGVNLLREGLDLPEVSLVAILDADKEGFLRGSTALIQTIGRASRNLEGKTIMYADKITKSMKEAIQETNRRRLIQMAYNKKHGLKPQPIKKAIRKDIVETKPAIPGKSIPKEASGKEYIKEYLKELRLKMDLANRNLQFNEAMKFKKEISNLEECLKKSALPKSKNKKIKN